WLDWTGYASPGYVETIVPALVLAVTFGLSMDYEVFLLTRIREQWLEHGDNERAVAEGLVQSARIITSAALVMVAAFFAFVVAGPADVARAARGCEAIVNVAAETHVDRSILTADDFGRTEYRGTQVLLEHVRETGARLVQVSTDEVYGDLDGGGSSREGAPLNPSSPYSAAKAAGDLLVPAYVRTFGVNASITRGSNTYGPNQYPEKF